MTAGGRAVRIDNVTRGAQVAGRARVADTFGRRLLGLMGRRGLAPDDGLLLRRCNSIHMAFMRFAIDAAYLDASGRVVGIDHDLRPWRIGTLHRGVADVLELPAGALAATGTAVGDDLVVEAASDEPERGTEMVNTRRTERWPGDECGQSLVETALIVPILLLLLVGIVDFGRAFYAYIAVTNAAREGARYAVNHATTDQYDDIVDVVIEEAAAGGLTLDAGDIDVAGLTHAVSPGSTVTVDAEDTVSMVTGGLVRALTFGQVDYEELMVHRAVSMPVAGETEPCGCSGR